VDRLESEVDFETASATGNKTVINKSSLEALERRVDELEQRKTVSEINADTSRTNEQNINCSPRPNSEATETSSAVQNRNIVIKNLHEVLDEIDDENTDGPDATLGLVHDLLINGLSLTNIKVLKAVRKPSWSTRPGIIIATLDSVASKTLVLKAKSKLRSIKDYEDVYVEPELSAEVRRQQRNTRILLKAVGKEADFSYKGGVLHRKRNNRGYFEGRGRRQYINSNRLRHRTYSSNNDGVRKSHYANIEEHEPETHVTLNPQQHQQQKPVANVHSSDNQNGDETNSMQASGASEEMNVN
jgi:hypothetical protein